MRKFKIVAAGIVLVVSTMSLTGCAGKFDTFQKAYDKCGSPSGIRISDEGKTISIDGNGEYEYSGADLSDIACVLYAIEIPDYVISNMDSTNSLMGRQTANFGDDIDVSWSYHPDNGLDVVVHKN